MDIHTCISALLCAARSGGLTRLRLRSGVGVSAELHAGRWLRRPVRPSGGAGRAAPAGGLQPVDQREPADHDAIVAFKEFAYEGLVERAHMEVDWARRGLALIDRLEAAGWSGPPRPAGGTDGSSESPTRAQLGGDPDTTAGGQRGDAA